LSPTGARLLRELIHERAGLFFDDSRCNLLLDKLAPLVIERGFHSFLDYYYLLRYDPDAEGEWARVLDAIAVPETYFWREIDQVQAVVRRVIPNLVDGRRPSLRIWSVPCSTGEEPLSIAMALNEAGWFRRADIEIQASDASRRAIEQAREGVYRQRSFRGLPEALREKYFTREGDRWRIAPELHARVTWSTVNLVDRTRAALFAASSVVFCRNLLIYFSPESVSRAVSLFDEFMPTPGYLCLGASESLLRYTTRFQIEEIDGSYLYVKR
jgi:chemotaxis protein methyltransferase CheR